jgi:hypothetical protein
MKDISDIQEIKGVYCEDNKDNLTTDQLAEQWCKQLSDKWNLHYVID